MIFGTLNPEIIWREILQVCPTHLSDVAILPWKIQKKIIVNSIIYPIGMGLWLQLGNGNVKKWE